jgi:hypothetical protein
MIVCGLVLVLGGALLLTACKKTPLLKEIQGIQAGIGRWDEASFDNETTAKFGE